MTNSPTVPALGGSPALGLWAKHPLTMDACYDWEDPPDAPESTEEETQIAKIWRSPERDKLEAVLAAAQADAARLLDAASKHLVESLSSSMDVRHRRSQDPWVRRFQQPAKTVRCYLRVFGSGSASTLGTLLPRSCLRRGPGQRAASKQD